MAAIKCPGCGAYLSVNGLVNCPRCQTDLPSRLVNPASTSGSIQHSSGSVPGSGSSSKELLSGVIFLVLGALVIFIAWNIFVPSEEKKRKQLVSKALLDCQYAIKSLAKFGDAEVPPYVQNFGKDGEYYFAWPLGSFHFVNGFGVKEKMSASCLGDLNTGKITQLTLNGKDVY